MKNYKAIILILILLSPFLGATQVMPVSFFQRNNLSGAGDGKTSATAGTSALQIKTDYPASTDGVYYINLPTVGVKQVFCLMNSALDGGGWMLVMKATTGNTFQYSSTYWTTNNTLNATDLTRNNGDAKYDVMNTFAAKDIMALWPDIASNINGSTTGGSINLLSTYNNWCWLQNNFNDGTRITPISFFNTASRKYVSDAQQWPGKGTAFSGQTDVRFYGFNYFNNPQNARARWGFGWNENGGGLYPNGDMGSDDVTGGIGLDGIQQNTTLKFSAGDIVGCCQNYTGFNRSARVEVYVR